MGRTTELARLQELAWGTLGALHFWEAAKVAADERIAEAEETLRVLHNHRNSIDLMFIPNTREELESIESEIVNDYGAEMAARRAFRDE